MNGGALGLRNQLQFRSAILAALGEMVLDTRSPVPTGSRSVVHPLSVPGIGPTALRRCRSGTSGPALVARRTVDC